MPLFIGIYGAAPLVLLSIMVATNCSSPSTMVAANSQWLVPSICCTCNGNKPNNSLISLSRSIKCPTTLEGFYINECKKLDLMTIKKKKKETIQPLSLSLCIVIFDNLPSTIALPEQLFQGSTESLQTFIIRDCPNIGEMPDCIGNLNKLQNLEIRDCPSLSKRCRRVTGEDWPNIKHIRKIKVDRLVQDQIYP
jgi:hypothetical protein